MNMLISERPKPAGWYYKIMILTNGSAVVSNLENEFPTLWLLGESGAADQWLQIRVSWSCTILIIKQAGPPASSSNIGAVRSILQGYFVV